MKQIIVFILTAATFLSVSSTSAQVFAVKSNALAFVTGSVNLGLEVAAAEHISFEAMFYGNFIPYSSQYKFNMGAVQPAVRYWFNEVFSCSFISVHAMGGAGELTWQGTKHQAIGVGGGVSYGYAWLLGSRWNMEVEAGVGVAHVRHRSLIGSGTWSAFRTKTVVMPSKLGINFSYLF